MGLIGIDTRTPLEALIFGALISAVDPVATLSIIGCVVILRGVVFVLFCFGGVGVCRRVGRVAVGPPPSPPSASSGAWVGEWLIGWDG